MRVLGIDYGERRIGLAISDYARIIAQPAKTIEYNDIEAAIKEITELCDEKGVELIVVGNPINLDGAAGTIYDKVKRFTELLTEHSSREVVMVDERFSSVEAEQTLRKMGKKPSLNKPRVDNIAAALILDTYLQRERRS